MQNGKRKSKNNKKSLRAVCVISCLHEEIPSTRGKHIGQNIQFVCKVERSVGLIPRRVSQLLDQRKDIKEVRLYRWDGHNWKATGCS